MMIQDHGTSEGSLSVDRCLSAGLTKHTRILAELTRHASTDEETAALAEAVVLMAGAALEAVLDEAAYMTDRVAYNDRRGFRKQSPLEKLKRLKVYKSEETSQISNARNALTHAEPDHTRTGKVGRVLNQDESVKIASSLQALANEIWGDHMPDWFSKDAGLT
jgi:hypothetical protein